MNRLQHETSPYLRQHAHNPVDWYAWSDEALERARREDKPILVSIGYSTCHWCHVMERESFEDEAVADYMNRHFVNIKIDREERPDLDQIYMEACQAIHGSGGWPLNCFLLPDGRPFFAGTYYPPEPAYNRPSWMQVLRRMAAAYANEYETVEQQAQQLIGRIEGSKTIFLQAPPADAEPAFSTELADNIFARLSEQYDDKYGGFGGAPKFPSVMALSYLLDYHHYTGKMEAWRMVEHSLVSMIRGGIYDQLGGGFARYATDRAWLVPHFEKMLYDNALLVELLSKAYRQQPLPIFQRTIESTLAFVAREMQSPEGGFYAALDADSEGVEGRFYVWDLAEVTDVLGADTPLFSYVYGISPGGNWEGHNIPWQAHTSKEAADKYGLSEAKVEERLAVARAKLLDRRAERVRPGLDDKILLSWNALMVSALAGAYQALGHDTYRTSAVQAIDFLLRTFQRPTGGGLYHTYKEGRARIDANLDDYAFLIDALLDVYEITFDERYIASAQTYTDFVLEHFLDKPANLFYFTSASQSDVPLRTRELYDNAVPSGNATMAHNLHRLAIITGAVEWNKLGINMLQGISDAVERYPTAFGRWANALLYRIYPAREVAVIGPAADQIARMLQRPWLPNTIFMAARDGDDRYPLLAGRHNTGETQIYVCREYACQLPTTSVEQTWRLLGIGQMTTT